MKKIFCCFKGESSRRVEEVQEQRQPVQEQTQPVQEQTQPVQEQRQPVQEQTQPVQDPLESVNRKNDDIDDEHLFDDNEALNHLWRNYNKASNDRDSEGSSSDSHPGFAFRWRDIFYGTMNFGECNLLGQGNFGEVYRCHLPKIKKVGAAKIQYQQNEEADREFMAEITTLHAADHPNVIKLLGRCFDREHRVIVYEFIPKGSLDYHLYTHTRPRRGWGRGRSRGLKQKYVVLNWDTRLRIAVGVAEALVYLHEGLKTIHRDVKVSNVLLAENFVPKLTDFGLATKMVEDENGVEQPSVIHLMKGTPGCTPPEAEGSCLVSSKSDVYSYGVFLLTLFTGRKAYDIQKPPGTGKLTDWLRPVWSREEYIPLIVDVRLANRFSVEGLIRLFQAARMCMDPQVLARPNMHFVVSMVREAAVFEVPEYPRVTRRHSI